jgi:hypothetical protein
LDWAHQLNAEDGPTELATAATDQLNLIFGMLCIPEAEVQAAVARAYVSFVCRFAERRRVPVALPSLPLFNAIAGSLDAGWAVPLRRFCGVLPVDLPHADNIKAGDLAMAGMVATIAGSRPQAPENPDSLAHLLGALGILAARNRNVPEAALVILSSILLLGRVCPAALPRWLDAMARADGLAAPSVDCDSYAVDRRHNTAVLLGTCNVYLALHALALPGAALYAGLDRGRPRQGRERIVLPPAQARHCDDLRQSVDRLCSWIDDNVDRLRMQLRSPRPPVRDTLRIGVEFAMIIAQLAMSPVTPPKLRDWAISTAVALQALFDDERVFRHFRGAPELAPLLRAYLLLPPVSGKNSLFTDEVRELIAEPHAIAIERPPMERLEYLTLCELAGIEFTQESESGILGRTLLFNARGAPLLFSRNDLYDITHAVFYVTRFGARTKGPVGEWPPWLANYLPSTALSSLREKDYDLGAELLLAELYMGIDDPWVSWSAGLLAGAVRKDGTLPLPPWVEAAEDPAGRFRHDYHTVLVALLCLAELQARNRREVP